MKFNYPQRPVLSDLPAGLLAGITQLEYATKASIVHDCKLLTIIHTLIKWRESESFNQLYVKWTTY